MDIRYAGCKKSDRLYQNLHYISGASEAAERGIIWKSYDPSLTERNRRYYKSDGKWKERSLPCIRKNGKKLFPEDQRICFEGGRIRMNMSRI